MAAPAQHLHVLVTEVDGEAVAVGWTQFNTWTSEEGVASIFVMVHPDHQRSGLGTALYEALETHVRECAGRRLQAWAVDAPEVEQWCGARGFARTHELRYSRLALHQLPLVRELPAGVSVVSFAEGGPEAVFAVASVATLDEPGDVAIDAMSYDEWVREIWQAPETDLDTSTLVLVNRAPTACTLIEADLEGHRVWAGGTGTLPSYRGRGLAKLAKVVALHKARLAGVTDAYTSNDEVNAPMLAVNTWLGYQACATQWAYLKAL